MLVDSRPQRRRRRHQQNTLDSLKRGHISVDIGTLTSGSAVPAIHFMTPRLQFRGLDSFTPGAGPADGRDGAGRHARPRQARSRAYPLAQVCDPLAKVRARPALTSMSSSIRIVTSRRPARSPRGASAIRQHHPAVPSLLTHHALTVPLLTPAFVSSRRPAWRNLRRRGRSRIMMSMPRAFSDLATASWRNGSRNGHPSHLGRGDSRQRDHRTDAVANRAPTATPW